MTRWEFHISEEEEEHFEAQGFHSMHKLNIANLKIRNTLQNGTLLFREGGIIG